MFRKIASPFRAFADMLTQNKRRVLGAAVLGFSLVVAGLSGCAYAPPDLGYRDNSSNPVSFANQKKTPDRLAAERAIAERDRAMQEAEYYRQSMMMQGGGFGGNLPYGTGYNQTDLGDPELNRLNNAAVMQGYKGKARGGHYNAGGDLIIDVPGRGELRSVPNSFNGTRSLKLGKEN